MGYKVGGSSKIFSLRSGDTGASRVITAWGLKGPVSKSINRPKCYKTCVMPVVKFTYALKRFFPGLKDTPAKSVVLSDILEEIEISYPGINSYILDEQGNLRRHVNIFINGTMIPDRTKLNSPVAEKSEIHIIQALSGG